MLGGGTTTVGGSGGSGWAWAVVRALVSTALKAIRAGGPAPRPSAPPATTPARPPDRPDHSEPDWRTCHGSVPADCGSGAVAVRRYALGLMPRARLNAALNANASE